MIKHKRDTNPSPGNPTLNKIQALKFCWSLHFLKMDYQSNQIKRRYALMNRAHILGFPNRIPNIDWQAYLPKFQDKRGDDASFLLIRFHIHVHRLGIDFPKDDLMKMFMVTLEEKAILWYEGLPHASLYSLKYFYSAFCKKNRKDYPSLELIENFCGNFEILILHLGIDMDDEELMDYEMKEALLEFNCQLSCSSEELVSEPWIQEEHVHKVVFLDTPEEQGYTEDQLVEEGEVAHFSLTNNRVELSHPPRYDESDDDSFQQPILDTSLGSDPI